MVVACMEPGGLKVLEGAGWKDAIRVRFLHAKVRTRLLRMASWDRANWGVAINQEDMAATVLSFQVHLYWPILSSTAKTGHFLSLDERH